MKQWFMLGWRKGCNDVAVHVNHWPPTACHCDSGLCPVRLMGGKLKECSPGSCQHIMLLLTRFCIPNLFRFGAGALALDGVSNALRHCWSGVSGPMAYSMISFISQLVHILLFDPQPRRWVFVRLGSPLGLAADTQDGQGCRLAWCLTTTSPLQLKESVQGVNHLRGLGWVLHDHTTEISESESHWTRVSKGFWDICLLMVNIIRCYCEGLLVHYWWLKTSGDSQCIDTEGPQGRHCDNWIDIMVWGAQCLAPTLHRVCSQHLFPKSTEWTLTQLRERLIKSTI